MRIIAGHYKGRNLKSPATIETRPTSDRLRETLFNVIAPRIRDARFLDLCAGSGAIGIEALSRGAAHATFVDSSRKMSALVESNLTLCRVPAEDFALVTADALAFLRKAVERNSAAWDLIFFDPPYDDDYLAVLEALGNGTHHLLAASGLLVVEHHHKKSLPAVIDRLERNRILKQGDSTLSFYQPKEVNKTAG